MTFSDRLSRRIRPSRVDRSNWKAECAETCLLRLERGKGCEALPIATRDHTSSASQMKTCDRTSAASAAKVGLAAGSVAFILQR
jgi:hypothetical protein